MANIKSSIKRVEIARRNEARNRAIKSEIKTYVKKFEKAVAENSVEDAKKYLDLAEKKYRQAEAKNVMHKNNISRKIGQLTNKFNAMSN
ncbi:30S ribosomal protein S20 [Neofamilia massiliensis]|uniref:30S ribosomal protein S20 n=1 Tax=Neofamilia massiliensis TaxID=1673724 RepID=UPI0006BB8B70|nr:30S ribosomal protein S20 [Neofamilia massiliensis]